MAGITTGVAYDSDEETVCEAHRHNARAVLPLPLDDAADDIADVSEPASGEDASSSRSSCAASLASSNSGSRRWRSPSRAQSAEDHSAGGRGAFDPNSRSGGRKRETGGDVES